MELLRSKRNDFVELWCWEPEGGIDYDDNDEDARPWCVKELKSGVA